MRHCRGVGHLFRVEPSHTMVDVPAEARLLHLLARFVYGGHGPDNAGPGKVRSVTRHMVFRESSLQQTNSLRKNKYLFFRERLQYGCPCFRQTFRTTPGTCVVSNQHRVNRLAHTLLTARSVYNTESRIFSPFFKNDIYVINNLLNKNKNPQFYFEKLVLDIK